MRIVVDAMGSDTYPSPMWRGASWRLGNMVSKSSWWAMKLEFAPVGAQNPGRLPIQVVHAPEMLTMEDKGLALALKAKRKNAKNSMAIGMDLVKSGEAQAFVTAATPVPPPPPRTSGSTPFPASSAPPWLRCSPPAAATAWCSISAPTPTASPENLLQFG